MYVSIVIKVFEQIILMFVNELHYGILFHGFQAWWNDIKCEQIDCSVCIVISIPITAGIYD
jgi:ACR3 family arsenite efflux pump ArsB